MKRNEAIRDKILKLRLEGLTIEQIGQELKVKPGSVNQYLRSMRKEGMIETQTREHWNKKHRDKKADEARSRIDAKTVETLRLLNYPYSKIAQKLNVPVNVLKKEFGFIPLGRMRLQETVLKLRKEGKSYKAISIILKKHQGTIGRVIHTLIKKGLLEKVQK